MSQVPKKYLFGLKSPRLLLLASLLLLVSTALLIAGGVFFWGQRSGKPDRDAWISKRFASIEPGMRDEQVIELLGPPDSTSNLFYLGQEAGYEDEYARAERSNSAYYYVWYLRMHKTYTIGFNKEGRVTIKAFGSS